MTQRQTSLITAFSGYLLLAITIYRWQLFTHYISTIVLFKILVPIAFLLLFLGVARFLKLPFWVGLLVPLAMELVSWRYIRHIISVNATAVSHHTGVLRQWNNYRDVIQFNRHFTSFSPELGYVLRPGSESVHAGLEYENTFKINSFGVRDDEASLDNPQLVFLGDSFTMGWGVDENQCYADLTGRKLGVKTLNAGISSYGTFREMLLFSKIRRDSCKLVVLQYCGNDREENEARNEPNAQGQLLTTETFEKTAVFNRINETYFLMRYTYFFVREKDLLKRIWTSPLEALSEVGDALEAWAAGQQLPPDPPGKPMPASEIAVHTEYFFKSVDKMRKFYSGNIIVTHLDGFPIRPDLMNAFEAEAKRRGDDHLYFLPVHGLLSGADFYPIDGHINARGHARIAGALAAFIHERALLR